jgi:hypothetical protein
MDLGDLVARFPARRFPWWITPAGLVTGAAAILFGLDGNGHIKSPGVVAIGVALIVLSVIGRPLQRRLVSSVAVHRNGLRAGRPGKLVHIAWADLVSLVADYQTIDVEGAAVPAHRMTMHLRDGRRVVLNSNSCADPETMMRTVEQLARTAGALDQSK